MNTDDTVLQLVAQDERVRALTREAASASNDVTNPLKARCTQGCLLARFGQTAAGPFFTSSWDAELPLPYQATVNGKRLGRRQAMRLMDAMMPETYRSGPPNDHMERPSVEALLALPPDVKQEYPDLMVRCKHGDAVLDRYEVLGWIRSGSVSRKIEVAGRRQYDKGKPIGPGKRVQTRFERKIGGRSDALPLDQMADWLGWDTPTSET